MGFALRSCSRGHSLTARHLLVVFDFDLPCRALYLDRRRRSFRVRARAGLVQNDRCSNRRSPSFEPIYPRYFVGAAIAGAVALAAFVAGPLCYHEYRGVMVGVQAMVIIFAILLMLYGGNSLTPAIVQTRRDGVVNPEWLRALQRRAAGLNLVLLA